MFLDDIVLRRCLSIIGKILPSVQAGLIASRKGAEKPSASACRRPQPMCIHLVTPLGDWRWLVSSSRRLSSKNQYRQRMGNINRRTASVVARKSVSAALYDNSAFR